MIADMMAEYGGRLLVAIAGVGLGLICLVAVLKFLRHRNGPSPFVRGGRARAPRLQVVDAAAVDTRRRLVLVRRDDVEHLIMIGGPADIIVESNIAAAARTPAAASPSAGTGFEPAEPRPPRIPEPGRAPLPAVTAEPPPPARPAPERLAAPRPVRPAASDAAEPALERPLPVTPQAAYFEASDDFAPTPAARQRPAAAPPPTPRPAAEAGDTAALREAEAHLEAMKRRMMGPETPARPRAEADKLSRAEADKPSRAEADKLPRVEADKPSLAGTERPSAFGQVLDEEMKNPPRDAPRPVPAAIQSVKRREVPPAPPASEPPAKDPDLQDEIARIFGDKR